MPLGELAGAPLERPTEEPWVAGLDPRPEEPVEVVLVDGGVAEEVGLEEGEDRGVDLLAGGRLAVGDAVEEVVMGQYPQETGRAALRQPLIYLEEPFFGGFADVGEEGFVLVFPCKEAGKVGAADELAGERCDLLGVVEIDPAGIYLPQYLLVGADAIYC